MSIRLNENECRALCLIVTFISSARSEAFARNNLRYDASEPAIVGLVQKGLVAINKAGSIRVKNYDAARETMFAHDRPADFYENSSMFFGERARQNYIALKSAPMPDPYPWRA
jgi:hypothetical protein